MFRIDVGPAGAAEAQRSSDICERVRCHAGQQRAAMYYAKVDTARIGVIRQLASAGLYVVDVNVTFAREPGSQTGSSKPARAGIGEIGPEQHQDVLDIAGSCFRYSRFHLDPLVPDKIADRIKHDWVMSYIRKARGERLFSVSIDGRVVGFLAVLASQSQGKRVRTIDLMGVRESSQRQGIGRTLVSFFVERYRAQCDRFEVGTQVANLPSMRLYETCGFSLVRSAYVLHMHVGSSTSRD